MSNNHQSEQELYQMAEKGRRFQGLQKDLVFQELLSEAKRFIQNKWQQCPINDEATAREAKLEFEAMKRLDSMVNGFINIGNVAQTALEKLEKERERK